MSSQPHNDSSRFKPEDRPSECPWETGEIECCPAFMERMFLKNFPCPHVEDCEDYISEIADRAEGLI